MILANFFRQRHLSRLVTSLGALLVGAAFLVQLVVLFRIHAELRQLNHITLMMQSVAIVQLQHRQRVDSRALSPAAQLLLKDE